MATGIRRGTLPFSPIAIFCILVFCGTSLASSAPGHMDALTSILPIEIRGSTETNSTSGAVRVEPKGPLADIQLSAEHLVIEHAWQRSARVQALKTNIVLDRGEDSIALNAATVRFKEFDGWPLLLAVLDRPGQIRISSADGLSVKPATNLTLAGVGMNPKAASVGDAPDLGYWYTTDGPTVTGSGDGLLSVRGSFSVFVHNLSVAAEGDGASWSNWTGRRESQADGPATDTELRITVLHVTNGTFYTSSTRSTVFAFPKATVNMYGFVALESATGKIAEGDRKLVLENEPLILAGAGDVRMVAARGIDGGPPHLSIQPMKGLHVEATTGSWTESGSTGARSWPVTIAGVGATSVTLMAFAILLEVGVVPGTKTALAGGPHHRWMRRGRRAAESGHWPLAAWCYRNAVRTKDDDALAWYDWAGAELQARRWNRADRIAERAATIPGIERADLLELRVTSAWCSGNRAACREHLNQLAREEPAMAVGLVKDLQIDLAALGGPVPSLPAVHTTEDPPYGYA